MNCTTLSIVEGINALPISKILSTLLPAAAIVVRVALVSLVPVVVPVAVAAIVVAAVVVVVVVIVIVVVVVDSAGEISCAQEGLLPLVPDAVVAAVVAGVEGTSAGLDCC